MSGGRASPPPDISTVKNTTCRPQFLLFLGMEFVLYYRGPLRANAGPADKQAIRRALHAQLKELWQQKPLKAYAETLLASARRNRDFWSLRPLGPFTLAPLVTEETRQVADLHVTFMRPEEPGSLITQGGDIDNRMKTLFDALRMPKSLDELPKGAHPAPDENPLYCLLEDDNLITGIHVQTERLLDANAHQNEVLLLIRVRTRLTELVFGNIGLQ